MKEKLEMEKKYDKFAEGIKQDTGNFKNLHNNVSPVLKYFRHRKIETALRLGVFKKGEKVLETGSNAGQFTTCLREKGLLMTGIDLSSKVVEIARKNARALNMNDIEYFPALKRLSV